MSHRTQITLEDGQYDRLLAESRASGVGLAELIRRAVDRMYGRVDADDFVRALDASFGAWGDESPDVEDRGGEEYVDSIRTARADRFPEW